MMFKARCPAKINLFLKLLGKRDDGYHALESLFGFLDIYDELEVGVTEETLKHVQDDDGGGNLLTIDVMGPHAGKIDPENNLFTQIFRFFSQEFPITHQVHIKITKNIPVGAGLGGGSSDAAYFMKALNELFSLGLGKEALQELSLHFGSDIAFFFEEKASIVKGRGEFLENVADFDPIPALLINPGTHLSTKEVFDRCDQNYSSEISNEELQQRDIVDLMKHLPNDTTKAAIAIEPVIQHIIDTMKKEGANIAKMSGTGSTCFAVFDSQAARDIAMKNLTKIFPDFLIQQTRILSHA